MLGCENPWVFTGHKPLVGLLRVMDQENMSVCLLRISERLHRWNFEIYHTPGKTNAIPDALSRYPWSQVAAMCRTEPTGDELEESEELEESVFAEVSCGVVSWDDVLWESLVDVEIAEVVRLVTGGEETRAAWEKVPEFFRFPGALADLGRVKLYNH